MILRQQQGVLIGLPEAFQRLDVVNRAELANTSQVHSLQRNEVLVAYGDAMPRAFAVRSGMLSLGYPTHVQEIVITDFFSLHDVYCPALRPGEPASYEVRSVGRCTVVSWPLAVFDRTLAANGDFCYWYLNQSKRRLEAHQLHRARLNALGLEARYAFFLWSIAEQTGSGEREVLVKIPQQTVASYLGVAREEVSRKKQLLQKAGFIRETDHGLILSPRLPYLFSSAEGGLLPWESD
jgi:CRP-like cAMP-binding protein